jgi:hypothetical protein
LRTWFKVEDSEYKALEPLGKLWEIDPPSLDQPVRATPEGGGGAREEEQEEEVTSPDPSSAEEGGRSP